MLLMKFQLIEESIFEFSFLNETRDNRHLNLMNIGNVSIFVMLHKSLMNNVNLFVPGKIFHFSGLAMTRLQSNFRFKGLKRLLQSSDPLADFPIEPFWRLPTFIFSDSIRLIEPVLKILSFLLKRQPQTRGIFCVTKKLIFRNSVIVDIGQHLMRFEIMIFKQQALFITEIVVVIIIPIEKQS